MATIAFVTPSIMFAIRSFSAPSQLSATSAVTPIIIGIILVATAVKVAIRRFCNEPNNTTKGFTLVIIVVSPMAMVAAKPMANACPKGINAPSVLLNNAKPSANVPTNQPKVLPSLSVNIVVISKPTLPNLFRATTKPPA